MLKYKGKYAILMIEKGVEMNQEKNKNGVIIFLIVISAILVVLCVLFATGTINLKSNEVTDNDNINEVADNLPVSQVNSFLVSDKLISTSDVVPAHMPAGYVFLSNGKFSYYNSSFYIGYAKIENGNRGINYNRMISSVGTWSINDDKLILKIEKEEYAIGGEENDEPPYPYISNYEKEVNDVNKTIEYTINGIDNTSEYMPFLSLSLGSDEIKWYSLSVGDYLDTPKKLAENGYSDEYYQLVK